MVMRHTTTRHMTMQHTTTRHTTMQQPVATLRQQADTPAIIMVQT